VKKEQLPVQKNREAGSHIEPMVTLLLRRGRMSEQSQKKAPTKCRGSHEKNGKIAFGQ
jgi:hypothetical protein